MKFTLFAREFRCSWWALGLYCLLTLLLCSLGFWQLSRGEQKAEFIRLQQIALAAEAMDLNRQKNLDKDSARYHKVLVSGRYDNAHQFLVDNQMQDGKPGFLVLTPFFVEEDSRAVLVNRGWLPLGKNRADLPDTGISSSVNKVLGRINYFPPVGIKLPGAEIPTEGWPALVQVVDSKVLANRLGYELYDFQVELDPLEAEGYKRDWKINTAIPPEKHLAYAVQWFGLALTLSVLFILKHIRKQS